MVSTDIESAVFHAYSDKEEGFVYVFEFSIPCDNNLWYGYPYLWKGFVRNEHSTWFALKQEIPKEFITKLHKIPYDDYLKYKSKGF